jgi:multiple sugar transport system permease protein
MEKISQNYNNSATYKKPKNKYAKYAYIFLAPMFIIYAIFFLYPLVYTFLISFSDMQGFQTDLNLIGGNNYAWLLNQPRFYQALWNTVIMWIYSFVFQLSFALLFAYIFTNNRIQIKGKNIYKVIYYLPKIITTASVAVLFNMLWTSPSGTLYKMFNAIGLFKDYAPLQNATSAQILYSSVAFWQWFGSILILLIAGMLSVSPSLYEAADLDGASKIRTFFQITLPLIRPIIVYVIITSLIGGLQSFELSYLFNPFPAATGYIPGGPPTSTGYATETIAVYIYTLAFQGGNYYNFASALSMILLAISVIVSMVVYRNIRDRETA